MTKELAIMIGFLIAAAPSSAPAESVNDSSVVIVNYFHGPIRCSTCLMIEELTGAMVETENNTVGSKRHIEFRSVDMEDSADAEEKTKYGISVQSIVLVEKGNRSRWLNLEKLWDLYDDPRKLSEYILMSIKSFSEMESPK